MPTHTPMPTSTPTPTITCSKLIPQGQGLAAVLLKRATPLALDWAARQKSQLEATDSQGRALAIALPLGTCMRGGDVLLAEDGSLVRVLAAPQPVLRITHCTAHGSPVDLTRAAHHLGHRHVPTELQPDHLKIEPDPVLAEVLTRMHLTVTEVNEPFEPEHTTQDHTHTPAHTHTHDHAHNATRPIHCAPATVPAARGKPIGVAVVGAAPAAAHVHGPGCGHHH